MGEQMSLPFRRRRLGKVLRELREAARLTPSEVSARLEFSPARMSRMESGQTAPEPVVLKALLDVYGVPASDWGPYLELGKEARKKGWWQAYGLSAMGYVGLEAAASSVRDYELAYVPGLLQTEEYIRAVLSQNPAGFKPRQFENEVEVRLIRQRRLTEEEDMLTLTAIVDEGVLRRPVGGVQVMRAQLYRLTVLAELPRVTLQVVPTSAGAHPGMMSAFTILSFPDAEDRDIAHIAHVAGSVQLEKAEQVSTCTLRFDRLRTEALTPSASAELIERVATEL
ncbi:MAG: helix-turn-helix domain-containing protein [Pseudonocardiaceae bacterium]|nr:helix-turn-helix domain-containing protein [Pseudonocardiaceae bacterium]